MSESVIQQVGAQSTPIALPDALPGRASPGSRHVAFAAGAGEIALIAFGFAVLYGSQRPLSAGGLASIAIAAGVWAFALRTVAVPTRIALGRAVTTGLGSLLGLVVVLALNTSPVGLHLSFPTLIGAGVALFCSVAVWGWCVDRTAAATRKVLVVGAESFEEPLVRELERRRHPSFAVLGTVAGTHQLAEIVEAQQPDIVVLTDEGSYGPVLETLLDMRSNVRVAGFESFFEYAFGRVPVEHIGSAWFMSLLHPRQRIYTRFAKRIFDVIVAAAGLVLAAPLMIAVAVAIELTSGGPVLYRQTRVGEHGRRFTICKFRSMKCDAERDGVAFSRPDDPRATRIGCFLRRTHLDELPQLWNVLRGDMSVVGPRPERPEFIDMIEDAVPFWTRRLLVKPGVTGWAQVRCGYASDCDDMRTKLSYDLWYLRHRSLLVDLIVCAMTFFAVFRRPVRP
jgi:exopolysaccharide biosynthesis polyprenyl glycosylphosphotransferase